MQGLGCGGLLVKTHGVPKSPLVLLRKQKILINHVIQLNEGWLRAACVS